MCCGARRTLGKPLWDELSAELPQANWRSVASWAVFESKEKRPRSTITFARSAIEAEKPPLGRACAPLPLSRGRFLSHSRRLRENTPTGVVVEELLEGSKAPWSCGARRTLGKPLWDELSAELPQANWRSVASWAVFESKEKRPRSTITFARSAIEALRSPLWGAHARASPPVQPCPGGDFCRIRDDLGKTRLPALLLRSCSKGRRRLGVVVLDGPLESRCGTS